MVSEVFQSANDEQVSRTPIIVRDGTEYKMSFMKSVKDKKTDEEIGIVFADETAPTLRELEGTFTRQASQSYYQESYPGQNAPISSIFVWGLSQELYKFDYLNEIVPGNKPELTKV